MMIGREYSHVFPPKPPPQDDGRGRRSRGPQRLTGPTGCSDISLRMRAPARSSASAASTARASANCCSRCSACCAAYAARFGSTASRSRSSSPSAAKSSDDRHGAHPRGPQDRGADAADVGRATTCPSPRSIASRAAASSTGRRGQAGRRDDRARSRSAPAATEIPVGALSGGNQQKVVIAKWLMAEPRIILLNDPTRGIDVGTKQEIYQLLRRLADAGAAILFYSTDYDELIGCCDRVLVLYDGAIKRELVGAEITERALIAAPSISPTSRTARQPGRGRNERLALRLQPEPRDAARVRLLRRDVRDLRQQSSGRLQRQRGPDRGEQGRAARARRDGADLRRDHRRHRPVGRHDLRPDQLPRVVDRRRYGSRAPRSASSACSPTGLACGAINGLIVIYGRLQPIVTTIATGAVFFGIALAACARRPAATSTGRSPTR